MSATFWLPLLAGGGFGLLAPRWSRRVAGRATLAQALLQAAETGHVVRPGAVVLAAGQLAVVERIAALDQPAPRPRLWRIGLLAALVGAAVWAAAEGMQQTEHLFELAQAAWRAGRR